jgi:hypothetical protein
MAKYSSFFPFSISFNKTKKPSEVSKPATEMLPKAEVATSVAF